MTYITLTNSDELAKVDDTDYDLVSKNTWRKSSRGYVVSGQGSRHTMHRMIMEPASDKEVDHINHDKLDNRRSNLRVCTHKENMNNRLPFSRNALTISTSIGVYWSKYHQKWHARVQLQGKRKSLGLFDNKNEAIAKVASIREEITRWQHQDTH